MKPERESDARQGGWFFVAAGILTILNNYVPGGEYLDKGFMLGLGIGCILLGVVVLKLPWSRWPWWTELTLPVISFGLIALANNAGGVSAYTFGTFFVFVFVWIGMAQPPGMSLKMAPVAALFYVLPGAVGDVATAGAVSSVPLVIPICVLVGETIARSLTETRRRGEALHEAQERFRLAFDNAPIGIGLADLDRQWVTVNATFCGILGRRPERFATMTVSDFLHPDDLGDDDPQLRRLLAGDITSYSAEKALPSRRRRRGVDQPFRVAGARRRRAAVVLHHPGRGHQPAQG